jgi:hypothetical protein
MDKFSVFMKYCMPIYCEENVLNEQNSVGHKCLAWFFRLLGTQGHFLACYRASQGVDFVPVCKGGPQFFLH